MLDIVPREPTPKEAAKGLTLESPAVRNRLGQRGDPARTQGKAGAVLRQAPRLDDRGRQLRGRLGPDRGSRLDHRGRQGGHGDQAQGPRRGRETSQARLHREHQHLRPLHRRHGARPGRRVSTLFPRNAFLQSSALPPSARDHPRLRDGPQGRGRSRAVRRPTAGQGHRRRPRHAQLRRQPRRRIRRARRHPHHAGDGPDRRGGRLPDRAPHRAPQERHVPHRRSGRARHLRARRGQRLSRLPDDESREMFRPPS